METYCISNEFNVIDIESFTLWAKHRNLEVKISPTDDSVVILPIGEYWHAKDEEAFLLQELSAHLEDSQVAILYTAEMDASTMGHALLVNSKGETRKVSLIEAAEQMRIQLQH